VIAPATLKAAVDGAEARAGGAVDVGDGVEQAGQRVAAGVGAGQLLVAERQQPADQGAAGRAQAPRAAQPGASGRGRDARLAGQRPVPGPAGRANERAAGYRPSLVPFPASSSPMAQQPAYIVKRDDAQHPRS